MASRALTSFVATEVMTLLDIAPSDLSDPRRLAKLEKVVRILERLPNPRQKVLKLISKSSREDKLDVLWSWAELNEKHDTIISSLNQDLFDDEVKAELTAGYITKLSRDRVMTQLQSLKKQKEDKIAREQTEKAGKKEAKQTEKAVKEAFEMFDVDEVIDQVHALEGVSEELKLYD